MVGKGGERGIHQEDMGNGLKFDIDETFSKLLKFGIQQLSGLISVMKSEIFRT